MHRILWNDILGHVVLVSTGDLSRFEIAHAHKVNSINWFVDLCLIFKVVRGKGVPLSCCPWTINAVSLLVADEGKVIGSYFICIS